jgi:hypothetical protein
MLILCYIVILLMFFMSFLAENMSSINELSTNHAQRFYWPLLTPQMMQGVLEKLRLGLP